MEPLVVLHLDNRLVMAQTFFHKIGIYTIPKITQLLNRLATSNTKVYVQSCDEQTLLFGLAVQIRIIDKEMTYFNV